MPASLISITTPTLTLTLQCETKLTPLPTLEQFQTWVEAALQHRAIQAEICIRLVDKLESAALNEQYRHKTGPTNVLSFNSSLPPEVAADFLLGDLVMCAPLVAEEATSAETEVFAHWAHLTVHGCLHLLGYDHEHDADATIMEKQETAIMLGLGLKDPYSH